MSNQRGRIPRHLLPVLLLSAIAGILLLSRSGFSLLSYPHMFPDSYDWLVNGLRYSRTIQQPFEISHRSLLLPLTAAVLFNLHVEDLLPYIGTAFFCLSVIVLYFALPFCIPMRIARLTTLLFVSSYTIQAQSAFIGADVLGNAFLMATGMLFYRFLAADNPRLLVWVGLCIGLGIHAQYILIIFLPTMLAGLLLPADGTLRISGHRIGLLLRSRWFYLGIAVAVAVAVLILLSRIILFFTLYQERVQHGSLVSPHLNDGLYYWRALLASFSWPIIFLGGLGIGVGLFRRELRLFSAYQLIWLLDMLAFFSFLYTWKDVRFMLYAALPVLYFAAVGWAAVLDWSKRHLERMPVRGLASGTRAVLSVLLLFYIATPFTVSPWDLSMLLTPWQAAEYGPNGWQIKRGFPEPYLLAHWRDSASERAQRSRLDFDNDFLSKPLQRVAERLRSDPSIGSTRLVYFQQLSPEEYYYVHNRNILYFRREVETIASPLNLLRSMQTGDAVLIAHRSDLALVGLLKGEQATCGTRLLLIEPYVALLIRSAEFRDSPANSIITRLNLFQSIRGVRRVESLFDGVTDDPHSFAEAPCGTPMEFIFRKPQLLSGLSVFLWDLDGRFYRFQVDYRQAGAWFAVPDIQTRNASGRQEIPLPSAPLEGIRITGLYNSDQERNPANSILHIREIQFNKM